MLRALRSWIAAKLDIKDESAKNGDWWEVDLLIVVIFGSFLSAILAWVIHWD